jgi:predicted nucleotide-binding protein
VDNDEALANELAAVAELLQVEQNDTLINQEAPDNDLYLILAGEVSIRVNGRHVAVRPAGQSVGEIAFIDSSAPRSATAVATQRTVLAKIPERTFCLIADKYSSMWRQLALELSRCIREIGGHIRCPNPRPVIFIGSSAESRVVAWEIRDGLAYENAIPRAWTDDVFLASAVSIENLEREIQATDFAILVFTPSDAVTSRGAEQNAPRDNVVWEHGFFTGGLGRARTFLVRPRGVELKIPSDLLGVTSFEYDPIGEPDDLPARLRPVVNGIRKVVDRLGAK